MSRYVTNVSKLNCLKEFELRVKWCNVPKWCTIRASGYFDSENKHASHPKKGSSIKCSSIATFMANEVTTSILFPLEKVQERKEKATYLSPCSVRRIKT